ncbi:MAG: biotin/lipoyl-binding protein [Anaerolineae bacterium]|jgi:biotin carboxyl carrier protein|nr:biotin/lipoyl-binding protein [Anaerolineae bacterium]
MSRYRIIVDGRAYVVEVGDIAGRPVLATVDGETFQVEVESQGAAPAVVSTAASPVSAPRPEVLHAVPKTPVTTSGDTVTAPLPGTIVTVSVAVGDRVEPGQELCVLEAMKMNNPIRSTRSGVVTEVLVNVGQQVQHGNPLMLIAEA